MARVGHAGRQYSVQGRESDADPTDDLPLRSEASKHQSKERADKDVLMDSRLPQPPTAESLHDPYNSPLVN